MSIKTNSNAKIVHFGIVLLFMLAWSCATNTSNKTDSTALLETKVFEIQNGKYYGYEILINGEVYIHQEQIPAIEGIKYFQTAELAMKVGNAVKDKLESNKHPGLTKEEVTFLLGNY
ncbi:protein of unknown function [Mariniphaga anaerophila]|uniref:DUF4907 domain-containing protein n=1 Tax=Mariniphaga anaerophila TaxID=1484053 RepID=A0A1M4TLH0_9BACT|nr:DUF4907 domain-containing protein [Mariniphaga anaerophila]SHE45255.1 protein of unknown function [Mariniphaga anaerophila]